MLKFCLLPKTDPPYLTIWYQKLLRAFAGQPGLVKNPAQADLIIPTFDVALETNWPYYGRQNDAFLKGCVADYYGHAESLISRLLASLTGTKIFVIDMAASSMLAKRFGAEKRIIFAFASAAEKDLRRGWDFGFPASPIVPGDILQQGRKRKILVSFIGANSHPVRGRLAKLHNEKDVIVRVLRDLPYVGKISALTTKRRGEAREFISLAENSTFSFVPRGDTLFSYRLLEVMRAGSIPVILSDGWALPFAGLVDWKKCAVIWPEKDTRRIPDYLRSLSDSVTRSMSERVAQNYSAYFSSFERQAAGALSIIAKNIRNRHEA